MSVENQQERMNMNTEEKRDKESRSALQFNQDAARRPGFQSTETPWIDRHSGMMGKAVLTLSNIFRHFCQTCFSPCRRPVL